MEWNRIADFPDFRRSDFADFYEEFEFVTRSFTRPSKPEFVLFLFP